MDFLSRETGATRLIANTDERNTRALKLLTSLGFVNRQEKNWSENFKNELVTVLYFERTI